MHKAEVLPIVAMPHKVMLANKVADTACSIAVVAKLMLELQPIVVADLIAVEPLSLTLKADDLEMLVAVVDLVAGADVEIEIKYSLNLYSCSFAQFSSFAYHRLAHSAKSTA